jgi:shikimate dehydrogenase
MTKEPAGRIYGVLGYPVKHSFSPLMHNAAFQALNINAEYRLFEIKPQDLDSFFSSLRERNIFGLNVTIPYKEAVLKYLEWQSPEVRFTGASNTIVVEDRNLLKGWNTDGIGFHRHLTKDLKFNISGKQIIILGAGGAAKAVTNQLARHKAKGIVIYDLDVNKGWKLADKINTEFPTCKTFYADSLDDTEFKNADLLINATPVGLKESDPCLVNIEMIHKNLFVYDLIYNPPETKLLKLAKKVGARTSNGLGMLLYQGALSFRHFTGKTAPLKIMEGKLKWALNKEEKR